MGIITDPGARLTPNTADLLEIRTAPLEQQSPMAGELRIEARRRNDLDRGPADVLDDRFYANRLPGLSVGRTGIELDGCAAYRPAEFLEWLDAVRPYVVEATEDRHLAAPSESAPVGR